MGSCTEWKTASKSGGFAPPNTPYTPIFDAVGCNPQLTVTTDSSHSQRFNKSTIRNQTSERRAWSELHQNAQWNLILCNRPTVDSFVVDGWQVSRARYSMYSIQVR